MELAIEVNELAKTYPGDVQAVKAISFSVNAGEVFGLLGPNGAGKSTTVGMLTTTILPSSGSAQLIGYDVVRQARETRSVSSVVFQEPVRDRSSTTILLTTHYLDEAERLCDRLAIIHEGTIVALDSPAALRAELGEKIVELRVRDNAQRTLELLRGQSIAGDDAFTVGATITVPLHERGAPEAIAAIEQAGVRSAAITTREPTLDDVYLRLTGGQLSAAA